MFRNKKVESGKIFDDLMNISKFYKIKYYLLNNSERYTKNIICKHKTDIMKYKYISDKVFSLNGGWDKVEEVIKDIINIIVGSISRNN